MKAAIWTFSKPSANSTIPSNAIAQTLSRIGDIPVVWNEEWKYKSPLDVLFIVNGAFAFCKHLPILAEAVVRARRIIWIQNDYTIIPPKPSSKGASPFRAAFRTRADKGMSAMEMWSSVDKPGNVYINWNALSYLPIRTHLVEPAIHRILYYGTFRKLREESFERYFTKPDKRLIVATSSKLFSERFPRLHTIPSIKEGFTNELRRYSFGLYLEDERQHVEFHSLSTRFYEMLGAGLPILFDEKCENTLKRAGYYSNHCIVTPKTYRKFTESDRHSISLEQRAWRMDFVSHVESIVAAKLRRL